MPVRVPTGSCADPTPGQKADATNANAAKYDFRPDFGMSNLPWSVIVISRHSRNRGCGLASDHILSLLWRPSSRDEARIDRRPPAKKSHEPTGESTHASLPQAPSVPEHALINSSGPQCFWFGLFERLPIRNLSSFLPFH